MPTSASELALHRLARVCALLVLSSRFAGFSSIGSNALMTVASWLEVALAVKRKRFVEAALMLSLLAKFKLPWAPKDADKVNLLEHIFRFIVHGRSDLRLAPRMPISTLIKNALFRGPWKRHLMEYEMFKTVGPEFHFYLPGSHMSYTRPATLAMFVTNAEDVQQVLNDKECFPTRGYTGFNELTHHGLLGMVSGPKHHSHRSLVTKFLSDNHLKQFSYVVEEEIAVLLDKWGVPSNKKSSLYPSTLSTITTTVNKKSAFCTANVQYDLSMMTLDVIMRTGFGCTAEHLSQHIPEHENHLAHGLDVALKSIILRTIFPGWEYLPIKVERDVTEFMRASRVQAKQIMDEAKRRIESGEDKTPTMLSEMMRMRKSDDEHAKGLTDDEILDELLTIRGAGSETTSNTCSWAMYLLAQHPHVLEELREEADRVIKGEICTFDESKELKKHQQVVYETLRMYPTVPSFPRECHKDTTLKHSGFDVPKGSLVLVSQRPMNRDPAVWDRPNEFIPSRFEGVAEFKMGKPVGVPNGHSYGFAPWGAGPRSCVGSRLALLEATQILGTFSKRLTWSLTNPMEQVVEEVAEVTLGPKQGLFMDIRARKTTAVGGQ